jgi:hypothetical protein
LPLIFKMWQRVTMQPIDCQMCKTWNHWHSVDVHSNHIETAFVHTLIVCNKSYTLIWYLFRRVYVLSFASRGFVTSQFLINCDLRYLTEKWHGPAKFLRFRLAIDGM